MDGLGPDRVIESQDALDTRQSIQYEIRYSPRETVAQLGAQGRPDGKFTTVGVESAINIYNQLRNCDSDLSKDVRPHIASVELFKVSITETRMKVRGAYLTSLKSKTAL